jgi:[ribosomal protein S5]-alanine N-acetyltransferase
MFVSERITAQSGDFDPAAMARGGPSAPGSFVWRGQRFEVRRCVAEARGYGEDRGDSYVRRHYFEIETVDALRMRIYFERNPSSRTRSKAWWLYTLTYPDALLETPRLLLRRWTLADRTAFRAMTQEPDTMRYLHEGVPFSDAQADEALQETIDRYARLGFGDWAIVVKESGQIAGESGLGYLQELERVEIGWMLMSAYRNKGLGFEAASAVKEYATQTLRLTSLTALVHPENAPSRALACKLGMHENGRTIHNGREMLNFELPRC